MEQTLTIARFSGGQSGSEKEGIRSSFKYVKSCDVRDNPTLLKLQPRTVKDSGVIVEDLILDSCRVTNGDTYFIGDTGKFYKRTNAGVWSKIGTTGKDSGGSLLFREDTDTIYITNQTDIATYGPISGTPTLTASALGVNKDQSSYNGAATYTTPLAISETYLNTFPFVPEAEPFYSIKLFVVAKGTGNWTVTLHDSANNVLGTSTIVNASVTSGALNEFVFTPVRMLVKPNARTYHVHVTSSVADGTIQITTNSKGTVTVSIASPCVATLASHGLVAGDEIYFSTTGALPTGITAGTKYYVISDAIATGTFKFSTQKGGEAVKTSGSQSGTHTLWKAFSYNYETYATRLIQTRNKLHPITQFLQYNIIGNGNYLTAWEPLTTDPLNTEYIRHKLTFPSGYEVCGITVLNEFAAIACEKRSTNNDSDFQDGKIFFWDGTAGTYNFFIDVPEGAPYSLFSHKELLTWMARGELFAYAGGTPSKIRRMPNAEQLYTSERDYIRLYPNMATVRNGIFLQAFPSDTANTSIEYGVYGWGQRDKDYPNAFSYDYQLSTGTLTNSLGTLKIGMVKSFNEELFMSWKDGANYGVDIINNNSKPSTSSSLESLIFDAGKPWTDKEALGLRVSMVALPTGSTLRLKYKMDRSSWNYSNYAVAGDTELVYKFSGQRRFYEIEFGIDIVTDGTTTTTPQITSIAFNYDDLQSETKF